MSQADDLLGRIDFTDTEYRVKQKVVRNKYKVYDSRGNVILRAKQKMFKMKEEFPFTDPEGNEVFSIKAEGVLDFAGDYALIDEETGETVAVLDKNFTLLKHVWMIRDPDTEEVVAKIESRSAFFQLLRSLVEVLEFIPHKYSIEDADGNEIGSIDGKFSLGDEYEISIDDAADVPKEAVVPAAITIDALEGN